MSAAPADRPTAAGILADQLRLLTFRPTSAAVGVHWRAYLVYGLVVTWLAGLGRYWDHPDAQPFQYLGLGSVAYVLCLATLLWLLLYPLRPARWHWRNVLVFLTLTSLPAWLYAIPVERFMAMADAQAANVWFLAVVASWRVALLLVFLRRVARLEWTAVVVGGLMPLTFIVTALSALNLEKAVFSLMGGLDAQTGADGAYAVLLVITVFSWIAFPFLLLFWVALAAKAQNGARGIDGKDRPRE